MTTQIRNVSEFTESGITPVLDVHKIGVDYVTNVLIANGIPTHAGPGNGVDLILENGETVLVRAKSADSRAALIRRSLDDLKSDYIILVTRLEDIDRNVYIMATDDAKADAIDQPDAYGESDYVLYPDTYRQYKDNFTIVTEGRNTLSEVNMVPRHGAKMTADERAKAKDIRDAAKKLKEDTTTREKAEAKAAERSAFRADYERRHNIVPE